MTTNTAPTLRDAAQALIAHWDDRPRHAWTDTTPTSERVEALRTALDKCSCGDRRAADCPGEWEPGCDLGNNPAFVLAVEPSAEVAAMADPANRMPTVAPGQCPMCGEYSMSARARQGLYGFTEGASSAQVPSERAALAAEPLGAGEPVAWAVHGERGAALATQPAAPAEGRATYHLGTLEAEATPLGQKFHCPWCENEFTMLGTYTSAAAPVAQAQAVRGEPTVPAWVMARISEYGDARADDNESAARFSDAIIALRRWGAALAASRAAASPGFHRGVYDPEKGVIKFEFAPASPGVAQAVEALPLSDEQIVRACAEIYLCDHTGDRGCQNYDIAVARAIERAHGIAAPAVDAPMVGDAP